MEVEIKESTLIAPAAAPVGGDHAVVLPLSHLDNDPNLGVTFRYVRTYAPPSDPAADPFRTISAAIAAALVPFYPLAWSLRTRPDGRLEVFFSPSAGVPLLRASASCTRAEAEDNAADLDALAPSPGPADALARPCALQLTAFACGGYALGAAIHHALCDGLGATMFFNATAAIARGGEASATAAVTQPVWGRDGLLAARGPPGADSPVREFLSVREGAAPYSQAIGAVSRACFRVTDGLLDAFKKELLAKSGAAFTTFEALGAFIWRAKVKASKIPGDKTVKYAYAVNIRRVIKPALPAGYWGNGCVPMYAKRSAAEVVERPLWDTAEAVKRSKSNVSDEYVRSFVDFQAGHHGEGITAGDEVSAFTDWRHLGHSSVDFGSGGPLLVQPLSTHLLGGQEPCYFLPGDHSGFNVSVALRDTAMPAFKAEMERFCAGDFGL